jgi:hypothetical protein
MLEKIAKLLNQAENAGTEAEAAVFMEKAQQLATAHSVDLAHARHATVAKQRTKPIQRTVHIGERGTRGLRTICDLYLGIAAANDIMCTIAHDATRVYAVGFAEDIDVSEALFASLQVQQAKALEVFRKEGTWEAETVWSDRTFDYRPQTWLTARLNFQEAYASRIRRRLRDAKWAEESRRERESAERKGRLHLNEDGVLTAEFVDWMLDRHGLDLMGEDSTAAQLTEGLIAARYVSDIGGVMVADCVAAEMAAEVLTEYATELEGRGPAGTALALVEKREAVAEAAAPAQKRARGSYRGGTSGASSASGRRAGAAAAERASLGRSTALGGTKGAISA